MSGERAIRGRVAAPHLWGLPLVAVVASFLALLQYNTELIDLHADWLVARAAVDGHSAAAPLADLAFEYGVPVKAAFPHPRLPSAILLQLPLALLPAAWLPLVFRASLAVAAVLVACLFCRLFGYRPVALLPWTPLVFLWIGGANTANLGGPEMMVVALIALVWYFLAEENDIAAAAALVGAISLKLWPAILIVGLWTAGRRRVAVFATGGCLALYLAGLLLPGASAVGSFDAVAGAMRFLADPRNGSFPALLSRLGVPPAVAVLLAAVTGTAFLGFRVRQNRDWRYALVLGIPVGLLVSPLNWPSYLLACLLTVAGVLATNRRSLSARAALAVGFGWPLGAPVWVLGLLVSGLSAVAATRWSSENLSSMGLGNQVMETAGGAAA